MKALLEKLFGSRPPCKCGKKMYPLRRNVPIFVCVCGALKVGKNTITMSPGGTNVLRWSATQAPLAAGDVGMDVATGTPQAFVGGLAKALLTSPQTLELSAVTPAAFTVVGNNDYTGIGTASFARLSSSIVGATLTGIAGGVSGRQIIIANVGGQSFTIVNASGSSAAGNRFRTTTGANIVMGAFDPLTFCIYDAIAAEWKAAPL